MHPADVQTCTITKMTGTSFPTQRTLKRKKGHQNLTVPQASFAPLIVYALSVVAFLLRRHAVSDHCAAAHLLDSLEVSCVPNSTQVPNKVFPRNVH